MGKDTVKEDQELEVELEGETVGKLEVYRAADGTIGLRNVLLKDHKTGQLRPARPIKSGTAAADEHTNAHKLTEPDSIMFFKGDCFYYNYKWYC